MSAGRRSGASVRVVDQALRTLLASFPGVVWVTDRELRAQLVFGADLAVLGVEPGELSRRRVTDFLGGEEADVPSVAAHGRALAGEAVEYEQVFAGQVRRGRVEPLRDDAGAVVGVVGVSTDVSERRALDRALAELGAIVASSDDAIIGKTLNGTVTSWNAAAERVYGYSAAEVIGRPVSVVIPEERAVELPAILARIGRGESVPVYETVRLRKDGRRVDVALTVSPIKDASGAVIGASTIARDISEQRRAVVALQASRALTGAVFECALDGVIVMDALGRVLDFNPAAEAIFGYRQSEVVGEQMAELLIPLSLRAAHHRGFARYLESGEDVILGKRIELPGMRADGSEFPAELAIVRVPLEGSPVFAGFVRDISARKEAERAASQLAAIVEFSDDAIIATELDGTILTWNRGAERLYGFSAAEMVGAAPGSVRQLFPPGREDEYSGIVEQLRRGAGLEQFETVRARKDGSLVDVSLTLSPIRAPDGGLRAVSVIARDISERVRAEQALRRAEESYRLLFEGHPHPMWVVDPGSLRFLAVNRAAIADYGYSREEFLAMTIVDVQAAEDRSALEELLRDQASGAPAARVWQQRKKDGELIDVAVTASVIEFEGRSARLIVAEDVTQRNRLEEQLRQSQRLEAIGSLAGGIAHDFNNILLVIRGYSALLLDDLSDERIRASVEQIDRAAERAAEFTHQLLAFSRQQVLQLEVTDLNSLVDETLQMLDRMLGEDVAVDVQLGPDLDSILIDRGQLTQAILNLVVNAREAMPDGGTLTIRTANVELDETYAASHDEVTPGSHVLLQVTDSGAGIDAENKRRVFEPFFTTKPDGTGLGLAGVYGLVKQSHGHISLYSEPPMGATFKLYFPASNAEQPPKAAQPAVRSLKGDETILLVEDTEMVRSLVARALASYGYTVLAAADAAEALEVAERQPESIDLLLTDVVMPGINGRELAERLLAKYPHVKVLFTSGYPADTIIRHGIADANTAFLEKPYLPDELARKIREVID
jgi:PAS domain S-box-containing protein